MMSNAHIAVGVASALALAQTGSVESCVAAVIGGSVGGLIADCDITPSRAHKDALRGRLIVVAIAAAALALDAYAQAGICAYLLDNLGVRLIAGVLLFAGLTFVGAHTEHRTFTHSLLAMAAFMAAVWLACPPLVPFFAVGYGSHLVLDVTNKQPIRLLYPLKLKVSLGLCTARGAANKVTCVAGIAVAAVLLWYRMQPIADTASVALSRLFGAFGSFCG